ncbi:hypothetical protein D9M71_662440 [compost metagenome]
MTHLRVVQDPAARSLQQISGIDQFIDHPQLQGLGRLQAGALNQQRQGFFDTDQARQALRAAAGRQQTNGHFGQADNGFWIIDQQASMARQRQFKATAQRQAVERGNKGLAAGLDTAHQCVFAIKAVGSLHGIHTLVEGVDQILEVGTGDKAGFARGQDCTANVGVSQDFFDRYLQFNDEGWREYIH